MCCCKFWNVLQNGHQHSKIITDIFCRQQWTSASLTSMDRVEPNLCQFGFSYEPFCVVIIDHFAMDDVWIRQVDIQWLVRYSLDQTIVRIIWIVFWVDIAKTNIKEFFTNGNFLTNQIGWCNKPWLHGDNWQGTNPRPLLVILRSGSRIWFVWFLFH